MAMPRVLVWLERGCAAEADMGLNLPLETVV
jgi:hypothetical protein